MKALEKLYSKAIKNPESNYCEIAKCYNKIKSDLERKEKLEKEQEELIEHNNYLSNQVDILTKESEKLEIENSKLKAVVEILKDDQIRKEIAVCKDLCNWDYEEYISLPCSKIFDRDTFNLLKEMLK